MNKIKKSIRLKLWMPFLCLALTSIATNAVALAQWDFVGSFTSTTDPATTVQVAASNSNVNITATPLTSIGNNTWINSNRLPHGLIPSSGTPLLTRYVEFGVSSALEFSPTSVEYSKRSYLGTGAQSASIRSSLDGYATNIDTIIVNPAQNIELLSFDLTSLGANTGTITFRVYFYNAVTNDTDWADLLGTAAGGTGLVLLGTVTPRIIPTLSQWGLILLILSFMGFTYFRTFRNS